jgi:integrase
VFFGARKRTLETDRPWGFQAYTYALHEAEGRSGVPVIKYRGAHGFRRGISGDIYDATGSEKAAADWIGDRSLKVVRKHYLLERDEEMKRLAKVAAATGANDEQ